MHFRVNKLQCEGRDLNPTQKMRRYGQPSAPSLSNSAWATTIAPAAIVNRPVRTANFFAQASRRGI